MRRTFPSALGRQLRRSHAVVIGQRFIGQESRLIGIDALLDPQADPEATGPHSRTVRGIICGGCCGWPEPPTSEEVHEAMQAENRSARQRAVVTVLTNEASFDELMNAYIERAFTWRQLARALEEQGGQPAARARSRSRSGPGWSPRPDRRTTRYLISRVPAGTGWALRGSAGDSAACPRRCRTPPPRTNR